MKIIIEVTEEDFNLRWDGDCSREEIATLIHLIAADFDNGIKLAEFAEMDGETLH